MRWKKALVFAIAGDDQKELLQWLQELPAGSDSLRSAVWNPAAGESALIYLLCGWSTSGTDELRRATLDSVLVDKREIRVYASKPRVLYQGPAKGTADMRFIGWKIPLPGLAPGEYTAELFLKRAIVRGITTPPSWKQPAADYKLLRKLSFHLEAAQ